MANIVQSARRMSLLDKIKLSHSLDPERETTLLKPTAQMSEELCMFHNRIYVPKDLRLESLDEVIFGHFRNCKAFARISKDYLWPSY